MTARAIYRHRGSGEFWFDRELVEDRDAPPIRDCDLVIACDLAGEDLTAGEIEASFLMCEPSATVTVGDGWAARFPYADVLPGARRHVAILPGTGAAEPPGRGGVSDATLESMRRAVRGSPR